MHSLNFLYSCLAIGIWGLYFIFVVSNPTQWTGSWIVAIYLWGKTQSVSKKKFVQATSAPEKVCPVGISKNKTRNKPDLSLWWRGALSGITRSNCSLHIRIYSKTIAIVGQLTKYSQFFEQVFSWYKASGGICTFASLLLALKEKKKKKPAAAFFKLCLPYYKINRKWLLCFPQSNLNCNVSPIHPVPVWTSTGKKKKKLIEIRRSINVMRPRILMPYVE